MLFLEIFGGFIILVIILNKLHLNSIKKEIKDWEVGDTIKIGGNNNVIVTLLGWTTKHVYADIDGVLTEFKMSDVVSNDSVKHRRSYNDCKIVMKREPGFDSVEHKRVKKEKKTGDVYNGKNIDTMSEMECQVYLKIALENEEFEIADKIKKQMGKYK